jgi:hypothetical protein
MKELPEYFAIRRDKDNPLWDKYIQWLNNTYRKLYTGDCDGYYGFDGKEVRWYYDIKNFVVFMNSITLEQWDEVVNGFKLPKKWAILQSSNKEVCDWFRKKSHTKTARINGIYKYMCYNSITEESFFDTKVPADYVEITFEQFEKYALKEKTMEKRFVEVIDSEYRYPTHPKAKEYGCINYHHWKHLPGPENGQILEIVKEVLVNDSEKAYILRDGSDVEYIVGIEGVKLIKNEIMEKKVIGYKLIKPEYEEAALKLFDDGKPVVQNWNINLHKKGYPKSLPIDCEGFKILKIAGVLDLWFEPVYEEEQFKVGDWVELKARGTGNGMPFDVDSVIIQLLEIDESKNPTGNLAQDSHFMVKYYDAYYRTEKRWILRKATPEEIAKVQEIVLFFGKVKCTINKTNNLVNCEGYGNIKFSEIISLYEGLNKFTKGGKFFGYGLEIPTIKFGCVKGTFDQLEGIYNEIKKS